MGVGGTQATRSREMPEIHFDEKPEALRVPRGMLLAAAALIVMAGGMAATARATGTGSVRIATAEPARALAVRELRFADRADGGIVVTDAATGAVVHQVEPNTNTFIRGAMRGLAYRRRAGGVGADAPFRLSRWPGGRLTLEDPATGALLDLAAFGPSNADAFAILLPPSP